MLRAGQVRMSIQQARRWRDLLWDCVIDGQEKRNPERAAAAHAAIQAHPVHGFPGGATQRAVEAWPHLDAQARADWIWACRFVQQTWVRGYTSACASDE